MYGPRGTKSWRKQDNHFSSVVRVFLSVRVFCKSPKQDGPRPEAFRRPPGRKKERPVYAGRAGCPPRIQVPTGRRLRRGGHRAEGASADGVGIGLGPLKMSRLPDELSASQDSQAKELLFLTWIWTTNINVFPWRQFVHFHVSSTEGIGAKLPMARNLWYSPPSRNHKR